MTKFFNSTGIKGKELFKLNLIAKAQESQVFALFNMESNLTSLDCFNELNGQFRQESIRRCLSNLKTAGLLYKTQERKMGSYGIKISVYIKA